MVFKQLSPGVATVLMCGLFAVLPSAANAQAQIQVETLGQVEPFEVGAQAGISYNMPIDQWRGTEARIAAQLISDLPEAGASPLLNRLAASVLMSPSMPPSGQLDNSNLASLRLASLFRLGQLDAVIDLAERSPGGLSDPENAAIATRAFLALRQNSNACETAVRLQDGRGAVFWLKVRAFCLAREGQNAAAELTATLAQEADPEDPEFLLALNRMLNKDPQATQPSNALDFAMADFTGAPIEAENTPFALQGAFLTKPGADALRAARRKAEAGMLNPETLARTYLAWPEQLVKEITSETGGTETGGTETGGSETGGAETGTMKAEEMAVLQTALQAEGDIRAALLYQSVVNTTFEPLRAQAIFEALVLEHEFGGFVAAANLYADFLAALPQNQLANSQYVTTFFYALLAGGKTERAKQLANSAPILADDPSIMRLFTDITAPNPALDPLTEAETSDREKATLAYIDLMAFTALGVSLDDNQRSFLFSYAADTQQFAQCSAGARLAIADGAARRARAETFLRAALMLGDSGFATAAPECSAALIHAFRAMGYREMARKAALEMMLGPRWQLLMQQR